MRRTARSHEAGFTIIEIIVVIVLIGILALLAIPRFPQYPKAGVVSRRLLSDISSCSVSWPRSPSRGTWI